MTIVTHSSSRGGRDGISHIVPGRGELDLPRFLRTVRDTGHDGIITLEVDLETGHESRVQRNEEPISWLGASRRMMEAALS